MALYHPLISSVLQAHPASPGEVTTVCVPPAGMDCSLVSVLETSHLIFTVLELGEERSARVVKKTRSLLRAPPSVTTHETSSMFSLLHSPIATVLPPPQTSSSAITISIPLTSLSSLNNPFSSAPPHLPPKSSTTPATPFTTPLHFTPGDSEHGPGTRIVIPVSVCVLGAVLIMVIGTLTWYRRTGGRLPHMTTVGWTVKTVVRPFHLASKAKEGSAGAPLGQNNKSWENSQQGPSMARVRLEPNQSNHIHSTGSEHPALQQTNTQRGSTHPGSEQGATMMPEPPGQHSDRHLLITMMNELRVLQHTIAQFPPPGTLQDSNSDFHQSLSHTADWDDQPPDYVSQPGSGRNGEEGQSSHPKDEMNR